MHTSPTRRSNTEAPLRVLELFCGIGGAAAAVSGRATVVNAFDTNQQATAVYAHNFSHPVHTRLIEAIPIAELADANADLWWMSPPCQPYTVRGQKRDLDDRRIRPFLHLVDAISVVRPRYVAMENVPGFQGSRSHARLLETLRRAEYDIHERTLCPTELGLPNQRRRYYLVAGKKLHAEAETFTPCGEMRVADLLDDDPDPALDLGDEITQRYRYALDRVDPNDSNARLACFTSAYGRSPVRSGSYLITPRGLRRFSPTEILRSLGFPRGFSLPSDLPVDRAWRLIGNSLSIPAVQSALSVVPELANDPTE